MDEKMINTKLPAVILAAGRGKRLGKLSEEQPKPMTQIGEISIIENLVGSLIKNKVKKIVLVTGYLHAVLEEHLQKFADKAELIYVVNQDYDTTNNIYSLWLAKKYLSNGFYLFEADIFFENKIMQRLLETSQENIMLVGKYDARMEGTVVEFDQNCLVNKMLLKKEQNDSTNYENKYKTVNFYKIGAKFVQDFFLKRLEQHIEQKDLNSYYELIIEEAITKGFTFYALTTQSHNWWEVDHQQDLAICKQMFGVEEL